MFESLQDRMRRFLRVPPEPDPPLGEPSSLRIFRAAPGFLRYRLLAWAWKQIAGLTGLLFGVAFFQGALAKFGDQKIEQQGGNQGAMNYQARITFHLPTIVDIVMDSVGVERQRRIPEEERCGWFHRALSDQVLLSQR